LAAAEQLLLCTATQEKPDSPISELVLTRKVFSAKLSSLYCHSHGSCAGNTGLPSIPPSL